MWVILFTVLRQTPGALDMRQCFVILFNPFSNARFSLHCIIALCHKNFSPSQSFVSAVCLYTQPYGFHYLE